MSNENLFEVLFYGIFVLIVGWFLYKIIKYGGFRAAMFGAQIERTVGEVAGSGIKLMNMGVKIHKLNGGHEKADGLELISKSMASYQMMPITLSNAEAKKLIMLLEMAAGDQNTT